VALNHLPALADLPAAVRECLAGFAILTRIGWPADLVRMGPAPGADGLLRAAVGVLTPKGPVKVGVAPLEQETAEGFGAELLCGMEAWNAATDADRDRLVDASALRADAVRLIATFQPYGPPQGGA